MDDAALLKLANADQLPGLNRYEQMLAVAFLRDWHHFYDGVEFQAHVGGGIDCGEAFPEYIRKMYRHNSQKRIDLLARGPFGTTIVEIKHKLDFAQLGQLIGYRWLWTHEHGNPHEYVELVALGFECLEDVAFAMRANGVRLVLYPNLPFRNS